MTNLKNEIQDITDELKNNVEAIRFSLTKAEACLEDAQASIDNINEALDTDEVDSAVAFLIDSEAYIQSIGYKTVKFDTIIDTLKSVRFQIKNQ